MRILFAAVLMVVCSIPAMAQQNVVFYDNFESGDTAGWWAPARVGETGQKTCYDEDGGVIDCAGTGQDGDIEPGVGWPNPRFVDNSDGTVTDMLTGLVWLKDANCFGTRTWTIALADAAALGNGTCNLTDGSTPGEWRLPSVNALLSLGDFEYQYPALPNAAGTAQWSEGDAFTGVQSAAFWSSTSAKYSPGNAWIVSFGSSGMIATSKTGTQYVWPVRGGR